MFDVEEELKKLPQQPGVYIMKGESDEVIYVGKAINLRNRVRNYFQPASLSSPKVRGLRSQIRSLEIIVVDNELEAFILECNLIKKHFPKYNVRLKDSKSYPYLKLTINENYPRIFFTRDHDKDKARYFGPYTSAFALHQTLGLIRKIWKLRTCHKVFPRDIGKERPCLNFGIGRCVAPCSGNISEEEYGVMVNEIIQFLNGKHDIIIKKLESEMAAHSLNMEFEKAAELRDLIKSVKMLNEKQKIESNPGEDTDVIAIAREADKTEALAQVFFIRGGKMTGREHFMLSGAEEESDSELLAGFIKQFYGDTAFIPKEIITETEISERDMIIKWLSEIRGHNVALTVPKKGEKLRLVEMAAKNADLTLRQHGEQIKREKLKTEGAAAELGAALGLNTLDRIEAYDISNIMGFESVASMVVFEGGKPKRSDYRKFKIKTVIGANDAASMEEVITRRIKRYGKSQDSDDKEQSFGKRPDAIFVDGGTIQINAAERVLKEAGMSLPVIGMVKDDRHRTRGMIYCGQEITLGSNSEGFKLLCRIQDEVHRFAIEYHRKLHEKSQVHSLLDDVKGIGSTRRKALIKHFGSIDKIRRAEVSELAAVDSMNIKAAKEVYEFFRK